jgi:NAD(P)-dependent dehydrogenase (short-subunit alcohol dehydrogenase family)
VTTAARSALAGVAAQVQLLDVASQASVRAFARRWTETRRPLHVLVNNAGVFCFGGDSWMSSRCCRSTGLPNTSQIVERLTRSGGGR